MGELFFHGFELCIKHLAFCHDVLLKSGCEPEKLTLCQKASVGKPDSYREVVVLLHFRSSSATCDGRQNSNRALDAYDRMAKTYLLKRKIATFVPNHLDALVAAARRFGAGDQIFKQADRLRNNCAQQHLDSAEARLNSKH